MRSRRGLSQRLLFFSIVLLLLSSGFQNCGLSGGFSAALLQQVHQSASGGQAPLSGNSLSYPYAEKPEYYADIVLYRPEASASRFTDLEFIGTVTPASGEQQALKYTLSLTDDKGRTLCPDGSGTLAKGQTLIRNQCTAGMQVGKVSVNLKITSPDTGKSQLFVQNYE